MTAEELTAIVSERLCLGEARVCVIPYPTRMHISVVVPSGMSTHKVGLDVQRVIKELPVGPRYTYLIS